MLTPFEAVRLRYLATQYPAVTSALDALTLRDEAEYAASLISPSLPQWLEAKTIAYQMNIMARLINKLNDDTSDAAFAARTSYVPAWGAVS